VTDTFESLAFRLDGPLPSGISVLEASAGTGKTYTIAALAARYVAEGTPLERLLLITFTRAATGELRSRVRERLLSVHRGLEHLLAGIAAEVEDPVVALFAEDPPELLQLRCERLHRAIGAFDGATIATTHGFCQEVLVGLGIAADLEPDITFVEDVEQLTRDVIGDLYVRAFYSSEAVIEFDQAAAIARAAIDNPAAAIVGAGSALAERRVKLAEAARGELDRRKRAAAVMTYDDLLTRLRAALEGPEGETTIARLRSRYDVVLVDEFQDTDLVQWQIMCRAFGDPPGSLVLIADPKQAIYAFRGADVYSYLKAAAAARERATLPVNWRSDQGLLDAYDALFVGVRLGHRGIECRRVEAAPPNRRARLHDMQVPAPLRIRLVRRSSVAQTARGYAEKPSTREHIARDVAEQAVELLSSGARIERRDGRGAARGEQGALAPGDIAVLVRTNRAAAQIRAELELAGVPAVTGGTGSVFESTPAREWLRLLEAIEQPASTTRAHAAALTPFLGWSAERVAQAGEREWEAVHGRLHDWARVMRTGGVATLAELISSSEELPQRVLCGSDGERRLTDLRHVAQLLHGEATASHLGIAALTAWLRRRISEAGEDTGDEQRSRRLESDAAAVQVLTVHRSKGLEFPVVMLPFLWEPSPITDKVVPVLFHDPDGGDEQTLDVGLEGPEYRRHRDQYEAEQRGEDLRLAYVALTRARHQAIVWWAGSWDARHGALTRLLFSRAADGTIAPRGSETPSDEAALERFRALAQEAPGRVAVEESLLGLPPSWSPPLTALEELSRARFGRGLDLRWRRTSYTDITAGAHEAGVASEAEEPLLSDEPDDVSPAPPDETPPEDPALAASPPLWTMPFGAEVGTFVHAVLEACDFAAPDLDAELTGQIELALAPRTVGIGDPEVVRDGLRAMLETPLGELAGGARLRDVARGDRLSELGFELPLAGGDTPRGWATLDGIAALLRAHLPHGDPFRAYAERLADPALRRRVRGYLTGSLDLVVRLPTGRFIVCDYKTNWLAAPDERLSLWHHRAPALTAEMQRRHYCLQALLYLVALHRYLRWRLPGYEPGEHLGGALYLFVRGMVGAATPVIDGSPCGVFAWGAPAELVVALSDLLDGDVT
jgi:exodeoxyribonuclease V beta subunit